MDEASWLVVTHTEVSSVAADSEREAQCVRITA